MKETNKLYFTKFLPKEGDIKYGDYYHNGLEIVQRLTPDEPNGNSAYHKYRKYILFLCSRDIRNTDIFFANSDPNTPYKSWRFLNKRVEAKGGKMFNQEDVFKIIGEISPEALPYIKEGEEFDRSDFEEVAYMDGEKWTPASDRFRLPNLGIWTTICKMRCSLGHFH